VCHPTKFVNKAEERTFLSTNIGELVLFKLLTKRQVDKKSLHQSFLQIR